MANAKQGAQYGQLALDKAYHAGKLGAQIEANKQDMHRGWSVARGSLVKNEVASASRRGLTDPARRWIVWNEVVQAMDLADAKERRQPGCCALTFFWFKNLFSFFEFFFRVWWHAMGCAFWGLLYVCRKNDPTVVANLAYQGLAVGSYVAAFGAVMYNLGHPGKPAYKYGGYTNLDRPVPPIAAGEDTGKTAPAFEPGREEKIRPRGLLQNICFVVNAKHPYDHLHRYMTSLFCCMTCHHSLHPSLTCGPCCSCSRSCYNTLPQRVATWNDKFEKKRGPHLLEFYQKTFDVNSYEEYLQKRLAELAAAPPAVEDMERGANVQELLEEGLVLGALEAFVGRGPARDGQASAPARAALGVVKGAIGLAPSSGSEAELAGIERGQRMSGPVQAAMGLVMALMGDLTTQAQENKDQVTNAVQKVQNTEVATAV